MLVEVSICWYISQFDVLKSTSLVTHLNDSINSLVDGSSVSARFNLDLCIFDRAVVFTQLMIDVPNEVNLIPR